MRNPKNPQVGVWLAKRQLDPLLRNYTATYIARATGLSTRTLRMIDHQAVTMVETATVNALKKLNPEL